MSTTTDTGPVYQEEPIKLETPSGLWGPQLAGPPQYWLSGSFFNVVRSDTLPLPPKCRGLYVNVTGQIVVKGAGSQNSAPVTLVVTAAGTFIAGRFSALMLTSPLGSGFNTSIAMSTLGNVVAFCD